MYSRKNLKFDKPFKSRAELAKSFATGKKNFATPHELSNDFAISHEFRSSFATPQKSRKNAKHGKAFDDRAEPARGSAAAEKEFRSAVS